jgi:hypothetical protein
MSELKTNKISTNDQNNVAIDNALGLKSYTTTARNALTSVAGDMIYNTTDSKPQFYNGSAWTNFAPAPSLTVDFLIVAGGGGSGFDRSGGGGAGGLKTSLDNNSSDTNTGFLLQTSTNYSVTVGASGSGGATNEARGSDGSNSIFHLYTSDGGGGGGAGGGVSNATQRSGRNGGSGGGEAGGDAGNTQGSPGSGNAGEGFNGGNGRFNNNGSVGGGGGGASEVGADGSAGNGLQVGGDGLTTTIITSAIATSRSVGEVDSGNVYFSGGGGGGADERERNGAAGGLGGGGNGKNLSDNTGTANTGGGGGGARLNSQAGSAGGSGVVILRYPNTYTASTTGLTATTDSIEEDTVLIITAGTGSVSWA